MADPARRPPEPRGRFADVPEALLQWVRRIPQSLSGRDRYVMAGGLVLSHFLGEERLEDAAGPFANRVDTDAGKQAVSRLLTVAEALLLLRSHRGFPEACEMLRRRDLATIFFETSIARRFVEAGYEIEVAEPQSVADGLVASRGADRLRVTMLALTRPRFAAPAVRAAIDAAVEGTNGDLPTLVACLYPPAWRLDCWDIDFSLGSIAQEVLGRARQVNRLAFYRESFVPAGEGGAHSLEGFVERNPDPVNPSPAFDPIFGGPPQGTPDPQSAPAPRNFIEWVDWALASGA